MITILYGTNLADMKTQIDTCLPVVPNTLSTYSDTSTPNITPKSLLNFYYVNGRYPGIIVYDKSNAITLFQIDKHNT
jgi:hypothetical protein